MNNPGKFLEALEMAASRHSNQKRKGAKGTPYINHPITVASILYNQGFETDMDLIIAAVLHDTIEDTVDTTEEKDNLSVKLRTNLAPESHPSLWK